MPYDFPRELSFIFCHAYDFGDGFLAAYAIFGESFFRLQIVLLRLRVLLKDRRIINFRPSIGGGH